MVRQNPIVLVTNAFPARCAGVTLWTPTTNVKDAKHATDARSSIYTRRTTFENVNAPPRTSTKDQKNSKRGQVLTWKSNVTMRVKTKTTRKAARPNIISAARTEAEYQTSPAMSATRP